MGKSKLRKLDSDVLLEAFHLACARIADSPQSYEEANSAEGWEEYFTGKAKDNLSGKED